MQVVVVGYGKMLAALISGAKAQGHNVVGAFRIDRVKYSDFTLFFKDIFAPSADFSFIKSHKIHDIKAPSVNSKEFIKEIKKLSPDIILVGSWSEKFKAEILNLPKFGIVNCHPSLLPKHRGANPYFWAIYSGDDKTGVTFHLMDENYDTGKILMQAAFKIEPEMTGGDLRDKAANIARLMASELLDDIQNNKIIPVAQEEKDATYDKYPYQGIDFIDFKESAKRVYDRVRALKPWGDCFCNIEGVICKIKQVKILEKTPDCPNYDTQETTPARPDCTAQEKTIKEGTVLKKMPDNTFLIQCQNSAVEIKIF